jgi:DNA-binding transcriptional MerR regulator
MQSQLRIGEVARLLGVTTKTVRHYHKLGLLREPTRTAAGYRLYDAGALLRLHQIRRLQALGLSLQQIRTVLGTPDTALTLGGVLGAVREDVERQIALLVARREAIDRLLGGDLGAGIEELRPTPAAIARIGELLAAHLPEASGELRRQEERVWALIEAFDWPGEYVAGFHAITEHYAAHPEALRELHALSERMLALAHLPPEAPEVHELAAAFRRFQRDYPIPTALLPDVTDPAQPFARAFGELLRAQLDPAQHRLMALLGDPPASPEPPHRAR